MSYDFRVACELHSVDRMRAALDAGLDPSAAVDGKTPVTWLTEMYTRSDRFADCLRLLLDRGATLADAALEPVLLNEPAALASALRATPALLHHRAFMDCAFTPLTGVSLLHVATEFGHAEVARTLIDLGADVNARATTDEDGLGGQTPLFHAVNAHANRTATIMTMLLDAGADPGVHVHGLVWGRGCEWETTLFDLTPVSYAQCGLLPQMHRDERDITENVRALLAAAGRPVPPMPNVPNRYLAQGRGPDH